MTSGVPSPQAEWLSHAGATIMAIVNVNADSFSDPRASVDLEERLASATTAITDGAAIVDLGAQSAATDLPEVDPDREIAALVPLVSALHTRGIPVSVDTYKPAVAAQILAAGADVVNDYSGVHHRDIVGLTADAGAWYVLTHNPAPPKEKLLDPDRYDDVTGAVIGFFEEQLPRLAALGLPAERVLLDPGVDLSKTPAQSLTVLRELGRIRTALDLPLLVAISRKDVLGVLTGRPPAGRDPATLAVLDHLADLPRTLARVHDVAAAADYLAVRAALRGDRDLPADAHLAMDLRHERP